MPNIGVTGFVLIILVALLLFGPSKLPELGRAFGKTLREFKNGTKELRDSMDEEQPRKEIHAEEVKVHEAKSEKKPVESRRLPD